MIVVLVRNNVVEHCVAVNSFDDLKEYYPDHQLFEQIGAENIGWTYDGVKFSPPSEG